jgi:hypothetical protein
MNKLTNFFLKCCKQFFTILLQVFHVASAKVRHFLKQVFAQLFQYLIMETHDGCASTGKMINEVNILERKSLKGKVVIVNLLPPSSSSGYVLPPRTLAAWIFSYVNILS